MRVLVAGATGAIGERVTRQLISRGHSVLGLARDPSSAERLVAVGATPVIADALDRAALLTALKLHRADAVVHELTALKKAPLRHRGMAGTDRLRSEGTTNLLAAADQLGAARFVCQSFALGYGYVDHGSQPLTEDAAFGAARGDACDRHLAAMLSAERKAFTAREGIVLRYGVIYGDAPAQMASMLAHRKVPVAHGGLLPWIHADDAATATVAALEHGRPKTAYNVTDNEAASWEDVFTRWADALRVSAPRRLPAWMLRIVAPYMARIVVDTSLSVSNARAKQELGWCPEFPTHRAFLAKIADDVPIAERATE